MATASAGTDVAAPDDSQDLLHSAELARAEVYRMRSELAAFRGAVADHLDSVTADEVPSRRPRRAPAPASEDPYDASAMSAEAWHAELERLRAALAELRDAARAHVSDIPPA